MREAFKLLLIMAVVLSLVSTANIFAADYREEIRLLREGSKNPFREFNVWIDSFIFPIKFMEYLEVTLGVEGGYFTHVYLRDIIAGTLVYWITASIWHLIIYTTFGKQIFTDKNRPVPTSAIMMDQMMVAQSSLFLYAALPVLSELLIEYKFTRCYYYMDEVGGWVPGMTYLFLYIACVEIGIYWVHRTLHTNKFLYKYVHGMHHKYNRADTLTPWASIAFNPIDGICQASPYVVCLFFIPVNYFMHIGLLFFTGVWATNIHDSVPADSEPFMGAKYHTYHHTHYHYNFGQFFIFCDYFWGTLKLPAPTAISLSLSSTENKKAK